MDNVIKVLSIVYLSISFSPSEYYESFFSSDFAKSLICFRSMICQRIVSFSSCENQ